MRVRLVFTTVVAAGLVVFASFADQAWAQRGPGGGFERGRGGPGRGPFGPGRGRFGPGRGDSGPGRSRFGGPGDFLRRLDENGDGMLSPNESQGRAAFFLRRFAPNADLSRPIPIEQLQRALERMREERSRSFGPPGRGPGGDRRPDHRGEERSSTAKTEPLVPGFDVPLEMPPVPGFGNNADSFALVITDRDRSDAARAIGRYDANRDGQLDRNEVRRGRWSDDPYQFDRNRDGILTATELALRYARRRADREASRSRSEQRSGSSSSSSRSGGSSRGDGRSGNERGSDPGRYGSSTGLAKSGGAKSYRAKSPYERLPSDLPDWFRQRDADLDGQVMMFEYATAWTDALAEEFFRFDRNGDGVITPQESLAAKANGVVQAGSGAAWTSTRSPTSTAASPTPSPRPKTSPPNAASSVPASSGRLARTIPAIYLKYAGGLIKRYDKNGDGVLASDEWGAMSKNPEKADTDGNGRITVEEFALWVMKQ